MCITLVDADNINADRGGVRIGFERNRSVDSPIFYEYNRLTSLNRIQNYQGVTALYFHFLSLPVWFEFERELCSLLNPFY